MVQHTLLIYGTLSLLLSGSLAAQGTSLNGCLKVDLHSLPAEENPIGRTVRVTVTNDCAKDITAFRVVFRSPGGQLQCAFARDLIGSQLSKPNPIGGLDILRVRRSTTFVSDRPSQDSEISAGAALFADLSVAGTPEDTEFLFQARRAMLQDMKEQLSILESVSDYGNALLLPQKAADAKLAGARWSSYFERLAAKVERSDPSGWTDFVGRERAYLREGISLVQSHLPLENPKGR